MTILKLIFLFLIMLQRNFVLVCYSLYTFYSLFKDCFDYGWSLKQERRKSNLVLAYELLCSFYLFQHWDAEHSDKTGARINWLLNAICDYHTFRKDLSIFLDNIFFLLYMTFVKMSTKMLTLGLSLCESDTENTEMTA